MSLAIFLPDLRGGGAERVCLNLANELVSRGYEIDLVLMNEEGELLLQLDRRVRVIDLHAGKVRNAFLPLWRYLKRVRPEAVLANMWPLPLVALAARFAARSGSRIVGVEHTTWCIDPLFARPLMRAVIRATMRFAYPSLDGLAAVSSGAADDLSLNSGVERHRICTIHNPVVGGTITAGTRGSMPPGWAEGGHDKILAVGTLKPIKDYPTLLQALAIVRLVRDARLLILGEGADRAGLEAMITKLGLGNSVFMPGFAADPNPYYAAADLFVLSSRGEGFGNVIVEALAHGTPVVSTDCPSGPREILDDGRYGVLVPMGDVERLSEAMTNVLSCEHDSEGLKRRALEFSVEKATDAYLKLLIPHRNGNGSGVA